MVALSVSISAITSPDATESPFFQPLHQVSPVMVGERAGINTSMGIQTTYYYLLKYSKHS